MYLMQARRSSFSLARTAVCGLCILALSAAIYRFSVSDKLSETSALVVPASVNIGKLRANETKDFNFTVKNTSRELITITNIQALCGCIKLDPAAGRQIPPGGVGTITGAANFGDYMSKYKVRSVIECKIGDNRQVKYDVEIHGEVIKTLVVTSQVINFEKVDQSAESKEISIEAYRGNSDDVWDIVQAEQIPGLQIHIDAVAQFRWKIKFKLSPSILPIGRFDEVAKLHLLRSGHDVVQPLEVSVKGIVTGSLELKPPCCICSYQTRPTLLMGW